MSNSSNLRTSRYAPNSAAFSLVCFVLLAALVSPTTAQQFTPSVDPLIGTGGHGHTFPGATMPFGMVQLSPDTRVEGWDACAGYHYSDTTILGFSHLHLSGTGIADYGDILITPTIKTLDFTPGADGKPGYRHRSRFSHADEIASPGYYAVLLEDDSIEVDLTVTPHCGFHRYVFPRAEQASVIVDLLHGLGPDRVIESAVEIVGDREISGYRRSAGWAKDQRVFFHAQFSKPFDEWGVVSGDTMRSEVRIASATNVRAFVGWRTGIREEILIKVGISFVSLDGAKKNLAAELPGWDFDKARQTAELIWNRELSRIVVEGGTEEQRTTFYTALYHAMLAPNVAADVDGSYRGMDLEVHAEKDFTMHTVFSLWDTFRAQHPLLTLIDPKRTRDFVQSLIRKQQEAGALPVWELASNETWTMIGYHSAPVILDAFVKGVTKIDSAGALVAMKESASSDRYGLADYRKHGFLPADKEGESVSRTLEYSFDDWCVSRFAGMMGDMPTAGSLEERAQYFKNVFDRRSGHMRPRSNGAWLDPFDPAAVTFHFTEANSWQYSFFVPHDIPALIELYGGEGPFATKLDSLFYGSAVLSGREQPDITGLIGQYAHGNEPSHNFAYLYAHAGKPWKTQAVVRTILDSLYTGRPDGLCGNDDCGQLSAWYVFSALGLYPVTPGKPEYTIGTPIFNSARLNLPNRVSFTLLADKPSARNKYIQSMTLNGKPHTSFTLTHDQLAAGGELKFEMGATPDSVKSTPMRSGPKTAIAITTVPYFESGPSSFTDSIVVRMFTDTKGATIYYTIDGFAPDINSPRYTGPVTLKNSVTVKAIAAAPGTLPSRAAWRTFTKRKYAGSVAYKTRYSSQYPGSGAETLFDGVLGANNFRLGEWQGWEGDDLEATMDLACTTKVQKVIVRTLQDVGSWIFYPEWIEISVSIDGESWSDPKRIEGVSPQQGAEAGTREFAAEFGAPAARFIRVHAKNVGQCPPWHIGAGGKAWLFVDEITVEGPPEEPPPKE